MVMLSVELQGVAEVMLNKLVKMGYAKTKSEAIRQAVIHLATEIESTSNYEEDVWKKYALKKALEDEDWTDADKLFKF